MSNQSTSRYRADIDGLRAVAVTAVVLYHAGVPGFSGGFVGVDVFFVISGYVITSLILPEINTGRFSIVAFYQRRIRRIFPALIVVIGFCLAIAYLLFTPNDYQTLGRSIIATGFFVSNIFFWRQANYFTAPPSENPLLHTWSLSIEEQFYLFYPMFLLLISRRSRRVRNAAILSVCSLSLVACVGTVFYAPSATFYLGPTRVWELLVGGIIALDLIPKGDYKLLTRLASLTGIMLIVYGVICYTPFMRYPGVAALAPVGGAALLIWSGQQTRTGVHWLLSTAPFTAVGRASYSLYLWHFPLFAFFEYVTVGKLAPVTTAAVCTLAVITAFLSLQFVERPFRFPAQATNIPRLIGIAVSAMVVLVAVGGYVQVAGGIPSRMDGVSAQYLSAELDQTRHHQECMTSLDRIIHAVNACKLGAQDVVPSVLLWGDSHAMVTATPLEYAAKKNNAAFLFAADADCPIGIGFSIDPSIGPSFVSLTSHQFCEKYNQEMLRAAIDSQNIRSVVLSSRWTKWNVGESGSPSEGLVDMRLRDATGMAGSLKDNKVIFTRGFEKLLSALVSANKTVWIVGPVPEPSVRVPRALYIKHIGFDTANIDVSMSSFRNRNQTMLTIFADVEQRYPVKFIWPQQLLCDSATCPVSEEGRAMYLDDNHLSVFGSLKTAPLYDAIFSASTVGTSAAADSFGQTRSR